LGLAKLVWGIRLFLFLWARVRQVQHEGSMQSLIYLAAYVTCVVKYTCLFYNVKNYLSLKKTAMLVIDDIYLKAAGLSEQELKLEIAIMLFEKERLSLRKAAALAGIHWLDFMKILDNKKIVLHYDETLL